MSTTTRTESERLALKESAAARPRRRKARTDVVRFQADRSAQVDFINGTPVDAVPADHLAHKVKKAIGTYDFGGFDNFGSPLGRTGYHPRHLLGAYMLASMQGVNSATEIERRLRTDSAYRLVAGAREISAETLCAFRRNNLMPFCRLDDVLLRDQIEKGNVEFEATAVDSVRLEADVAMSSIRTLERSEKVVKELLAKDINELTPEQVGKHQARLEKHQTAVNHCKSMNVSNFAVTDPQAALMKFPHGGAKPGHRLTTMVAGTAFRFCIGFYLSGRPSDHGVLPPILETVRARLRRLGVSDEVLVKTAADAGFCHEADLAVAHANDLNIDVTLAQQTFASSGIKNAQGMFGKDKFKIEGDTATCPAGKAMTGPHKDQGTAIKWLGVGCLTCPLRDQCTTAKALKLCHNPATASLREELAQRMAEPDHKAFFRKRGVIVEPMYSVLEDAMQYRRVSSRHPATVQAEVVLKVLVYKQSRIWAMEARAAKGPTRPPNTGGPGGGRRNGDKGGEAGDGSGNSGSGSGDNSGISLPNRLFSCSILDVTEWPAALVEVVVDFILDLEAANWAGGTTDGLKRPRPS